MATSETPSWLSGNNTNPGNGDMNNFEMTSGVTPEPASGFATTTPTTSASGGAAEVAAEEDKDLPGVILTMRLANMAVAVALMACSIIKMVQIPSPAVFVLAVYATCGGLLICCLETQLKFLRVMIAVNFGFLFNSLWRFLFYILLASVAWTYNNLFGKIISACLAGCAIFNTYILCRYPSYRKIREKIAEEEDRRIESKISKEVRKQAARRVIGGNK